MVEIFILPYQEKIPYKFRGTWSVENFRITETLVETRDGSTKNLQLESTTLTSKECRTRQLYLFTNNIYDLCEEIVPEFRKEEQAARELRKEIIHICNILSPINMKAILDNPTVYIKPSRELLKCYVKILKKHNDPTDDTVTSSNSDRYEIDNRDYIEHLHFKAIMLNESEDTVLKKNNPLLNIEDLLWLQEKIDEDNSKHCSLHELLLGSTIILPKNKEIPRNETLNRRCELLKVQHENQKYKSMTKDVDSVLKFLPEDTIAYQLKQINKQLIAIVQFIFSIMAGFAFGFIGVELMVGSLDFGFRLLLGVACSLSIALAELYFLARQLNEDMQFENVNEKKIYTRKKKID